MTESDRESAKVTTTSLEKLVKSKRLAFAGPWANKSKLFDFSDYGTGAVEGLQLRVTPQAATWFYRFRWRQDRLRLKLGRFPSIGVSAAREKAKEAESYLARGIDPRSAGLTRTTPTSDHNPYSIESLVSEYMVRKVRLERKLPGEVERILNKDVLTKERWAGRDIRTITPRNVIELLDAIVERGAPVAANRTRSILGQMFKFAIGRSLLDDNPVKQTDSPSQEKPRKRALSDSELKVFLATREEVFRSDQIRHALMLLLLTLQRRGELIASRWKDIDLEAAQWLIPDESAKTGRGHIVPLSPFAVREFESLKALARKSPFVFPNGERDGHSNPALITRSLLRCMKTLKKKGIAQAFSVHDLRRTGRTGMGRLGVKPHIAEMVLNHSAGSIIQQTYDVHEYLEEKRGALEKWAIHLEALGAADKG